jgi:hypothetical protein
MSVINPPFFLFNQPFIKPVLLGTEDTLIEKMFDGALVILGLDSAIDGVMTRAAPERAKQVVGLGPHAAARSMAQHNSLSIEIAHARYSNRAVLAPS